MLDPLDVTLRALEHFLCEPLLRETAFLPQLGDAATYIPHEGFEALRFLTGHGAERRGPAVPPEKPIVVVCFGMGDGDRGKCAGSCPRQEGTAMTMRRTTVAAALLVSSLVACGGSQTIEAHGAKYPVAAEEAAFAARATQEQPLPSIDEPNKRCSYWDDRLREAENGTHNEVTAGVLTWHDIHNSKSLAQWAAAERDDACTEAKQYAAKKEERDRQAAKDRAEAEAQAQATAEKARDEAAWNSARDSCANPQTERSCDAAAAYVQRVPPGAHVDEARALLSQSEPLLTTLRQKREVEATRAKDNEQKIGIALTNYRMHVEDPAIGGSSPKRYVVATVDATVRTDQPSLTILWARASCVVGDKKMVDDVKGFGDDLGSLNPGETKEVRLPLFAGAPLPREPSRCEVWFGVDHGVRSGGAIRSVCYTPHVRVALGPCEWPSAQGGP